ncbi:MAG: hypothetical protein QF357_08615 [Dehalococcoidia bacterium]|jgi:hypothetical protein|nr:hypothetical protein [Dehalococcoidia bacterium]
MFRKTKTAFTASALAAVVVASTIITVTGTSIPAAWWLQGSFLVWRGGW